jgi:hypothetical protein
MECTVSLIVMIVYDVGEATKRAGLEPVMLG